jgi:hypothetical protein
LSEGEEEARRKMEELKVRGEEYKDDVDRTDKVNEGHRY